jgi:hypothetical protein
MTAVEIRPYVGYALPDVKELFDKWIFKSIETSYKATAAHNGGTPLAAYILLSSAIDVIAGFYAGRSSLNERGLGKQYKKFIADYMKPYNPEKVYKLIRCSLVHNFIIGPNMGLAHGQENSNLHLMTIDGVDYKVFDNYFTDFKLAVNKYFQDVEESDDLKRKFIARYRLGIPREKNIIYKTS